MQINITNGTGQARIKSGTYSVTSSTPGYDDTTINPSSLTVDESTGTYEFSISASGTVTMHVTEDGTTAGTPIVGATFIRCDSAGVEYGNPVTTDSTGNAIFEHTPYLDTGINFYYKQTASDDTHEFDNTLKSSSITSSTTTIEVTNPLATMRTINLKDSYYDGYVIPSSTLTLNG